MEYLNSIKLQIAEICFIIVIFFYYMRHKRIKLLRVSCFEILIVSMLLYLITDIITVYTINYMVDSAFNTLMHRIFYILMLTCIFLFSAYQEIIGNPFTRTNKKLIFLAAIWILPFIICLVGTIVSPIEYIIDARGSYSAGTAVYFIYACAAFYLILIFIETLRYYKTITKTRRNAFFLILLVWSIVIAIQATHSYFLISGLALSISTMILYFSFENPALSLDDETGAYNNRGFNSFFYDECHCLGKKPFYLAVFVIEEQQTIINSFNRHKYETIIATMVERINLIYKTDVFRLEDNALAIKFIHNKELMEDLVNKLGDFLKLTYNLDNTSVQIKTHALIFDCPKIASIPDDIHELVQLDVTDSTSFIRFVDEKTFDQRKRKTTITTMINHALENNGFEVYFQPIYSTKHKTFISSEALIRLKDTTTLGFVSPEEFIPISEKTGHVVKIGDIVFRKVCDAIVTLRQSKIRVDYIEVNLSTLQIINETVTKDFLNIIKLRNLSPRSLNLEITETAAVQSATLMEKNMNVFHNAGCTFSMDDFGTGYSNLSSMADLHYDIVKLDKSLLWPAFEEGNEKAMKLLLNTIRMLHDLDVHIVAEGVETKEMVDLLTENGVEYLQGYYFSKPIPFAQYKEFLESKGTKI